MALSTTWCVDEKRFAASRSPFSVPSTASMAAPCVACALPTGGASLLEPACGSALSTRYGGAPAYVRLRSA